MERQQRKWRTQQRNQAKGRDQGGSKSERASEFLQSNRTERLQWYAHKGAWLSAAGFCAEKKADWQASRVHWVLSYVIADIVQQIAKQSTRQPTSASSGGCGGTRLPPPQS